MYVPKGVDYFRYIADSRHRVQIGPAGWLPDYPAASSMLKLLRCDGLRPGLPRPERTTRSSATAAPTSSYGAPPSCRRTTPRADALWAAADKRVTDQAAVLAARSTPSRSRSSRAGSGNFQYSQQWGVLYDQLWVR